MLKREVNGDEILLLEDGQQVLAIRESMENGAVTLTLSGKLTGACSHELQDELTTLALMKQEIVLDFKEVSYLSSSCTRVLQTVETLCEKTSGDCMRLVHVSKSIYDRLAQDGTADLLDIETEG